MASVTFDSVGKVYPDGSRAVSDISLEVADGEFLVFVGPSGCGKTSALRMVAGLEEISEGQIRIGPRVVNDVEPADRNVAMVFQNYALYPHMSVFDNIAFALRMQRMPKAQIEDRVRRISEVLSLAEHLDRKPARLSGGQRQRVAMGRAMVRDPAVFLMDEPLSNLDAKLRVEMRAHVSRIQHELGATTIYVTHDQVEAMTMGDRVAVMRHGVLQQIDAPQFLYDNPVNLFVAGFVGNPSMNLLEAALERDGDGVALELGGSRHALPPELLAERPALAARVGQTVGVGLRPEHVTEAAPGHPHRLAGEVVVIEALGSERLVHVQIRGRPLLADAVLEVRGDGDAAAVAELRADAGQHRAVIVARFDAHATVAPGERIEVAFRPERMHFFDLQTGKAIRD